MNAFASVILAIQMLTALAMIGLILIQHGKGADMGASFGGGSSGSLFGASGSANFLSRTTGILAAVFFVATLALAYLGNSRAPTTGSVLEGPAASVPVPGAGTAPVAPAVPAAPAMPGASTVPAAPAAPVVPAVPAEGAAQIPAQ